MLLTLDRLTLFFHNLTESYRANNGDIEQGGSGLINGWANEIPADARPNGGSKASSRASRTTPALTSGSSRRSTAGSTRPPPSSRSSQTNNVKIIRKYDSVEIIPDSDEERGLSDRDETVDEERDYAVRSGKGKGVVNKVRIHILHTCVSTDINPALRQDRKVPKASQDRQVKQGYN